MANISFIDYFTDVRNDRLGSASGISFIMDNTRPVTKMTVKASSSDCYIWISKWDGEYFTTVSYQSLTTSAVQYTLPDDDIIMVNLGFDTSYNAGQNRIITYFFPELYH